MGNGREFVMQTKAMFGFNVVHAMLTTGAVPYTVLQAHNFLTEQVHISNLRLYLAITHALTHTLVNTNKEAKIIQMHILNLETCLWHLVYVISIRLIDLMNTLRESIT